MKRLMTLLLLLSMPIFAQAGACSQDLDNSLATYSLTLEENSVNYGPWGVYFILVARDASGVVVASTSGFNYAALECLLKAQITDYYN